MSRLDRLFFERETVEVAIDLLGTILVHDSPEGLTSGRIVEVEAYRDATDLASHAAWRKQGGVESMHGVAGVVYVYRSYGIHAMFNIVARSEGMAGAVLIRALEPLSGIHFMQQRRGVEDERKLSCGPGNLCQALGITLEDHGTDAVESGRIWFERGERPDQILAGERIGISKSVELPWRFFVAQNRFVSVHRRGKPLGEVDLGLT